MGNGSSTSSSSSKSNNKAHVHKAKVSSNQPSFRYGAKFGSFRGGYNSYYDKPKEVATSASEQQHGTNVTSSLDSDDTFNDYIRRAKSKIRTVSNFGRDHGNYSAPAAAAEYAGGGDGGSSSNNNTNNKEKQSDQFSEFIKLAKKKLRTTSRVGSNINNGSFQRG